jgi:tetratricopeptide (TPR) repeat protein
MTAAEKGLTLTSDPVERARLLSRKAQLLIDAGALDDAEIALREANALAAKTGDHVVQAECLDSLALLFDQMDNLDRFLQVSDEACTEALKSQEAETIGRTHNNRALVLALRAEAQESIETLAVAREWLRKSLGNRGAAVVDMTEAIA